MKQNPAETMWAVTVAGGPRAVQVPKAKRHTAEEVLIRVERVGICGTDLAMFEGYTPFRGIIGHEFAGVVVEADHYAWLRRPVTASINLPPDARGVVDWQAAKHHPNRAAIGIRGRDGAMAEYIALPEGLLVALPEELDFARAAFAEPLAAAMDAADRLPPGEDTVLLVGDGRLAQLVARVLLSRGAAVEVAGRNRSKLDRLEARGTRVLDGPPEAGRYSRVIEASGSAEGIRTALASTAPEGTVVLKSTFPGDVSLDLARLVVDEIRVVGSRCGDVAAAVNEIAEGRVEVEDLITSVHSLRDAEAAFRAARDPESIKVQLTREGISG